MDVHTQKNRIVLRPVSSFLKFTEEIPVDAIPEQESVSVLAARNGYECAQLLVFAQEEIDCFISVSDLTGPEGSCYDAENVKVYAEKYIFVDRNWQKNGLPTGNYPDALIPLEVAGRNGETKVSAGKNRGFWLEFFVPADQKPGIYRGCVTVTAEQAMTVPVELEVLELRIPELTGVRTLFHTNFEHMSRYENGDMRQMYDVYLQYLLKHRICQTEFVPGDASINTFVEKAAALCAQGYNTINLPSVEKKVDGYSTYDDVCLEKYLYALAVKSLQCGTDMIKMVAFYDWRIDEPFLCEYAPGQVEDAVERFSQCADRVAEQCVRETAFQGVFGKQIIASLRKVCHIITDYYVQPYAVGRQKTDKAGRPYQYPMEKVSLCPKFDGYDTQALAAPYEVCQERWWYGCNTPNAPFIGYHIDDAGFSPRLVGGLMARNGIAGNLYWANNIYTEINTTGKPLFLDDPYQTAHRGYGANGDGALLYPGSFYGITGPIGSIRLKQIREGNQDWDILQQVSRRYRQADACFWDIYDRQLSFLSEGTKIDSVYADYGPVHQAIMRLSEAAMSPVGLVVKVQTQADGAWYTVQTACDSEIYVDSNAVAEEDGKYIFFQSYSYGRWFELRVCTEKLCYTIPLYGGEGMQIILHETLFENDAVCTDSGTVTRNTDEIRRELTVALERPGTVHIDIGTQVKAGQEIGFEIKTVEPCYCTVWADSYEKEKKRIYTIPRWNRIQISTNTVDFCTSGINIQFETVGKVGIGDVYIRR